MAERLDAFMARANAAYYANRDPFADFTTAPEVSQVFGEVLGLWAAVTWTQIGQPDPVLLAEAGPGRGTLMADATRAIRQAMPRFAAASRVNLIETSARLRAEQAARLPDAVWHESIDGLPAAPFILFANEFFDALPVRQFVRRRGGWTEHWVESGGFLEREDTDHPPLPAWPDGSIAEHCQPAHDFIGAASGRLGRHPGAVLILDYGPEVSAPGDSLQALAGGRPVDPLGEPGTADLTAHVDFAALGATARDAGATVHGPIPQGLFLARLGLFQRANRLARHLPVPEAMAVMAATRRLGEPDQMGRLFKAMAITGRDQPTPPGFEVDPPSP